HCMSVVSRSDTVLTFVFFFSSRRRHTRSKRDWSSDVCSSDLRRTGPRWSDSTAGPADGPRRRSGSGREPGCRCSCPGPPKASGQIGRASCRERVEVSVEDGRVEKKKTKEYRE